MSAGAERFVTREIAGGRRLHVCRAPRFRGLSLAVFANRPLDAGFTAAALLPDVLRQGCRRWPSREALARRLAALWGAELGADSLKLGDRQAVAFFLALPGREPRPGGRRQLGAGWGFLGELLGRPRAGAAGFPPALFARERENRRQLLRGLLNNRPAYARQRLLEELFAGDPYAIHPWGALPELERLEPGGLAAFQAGDFLPACGELFALGPVAEDEACAEVERRLAPFLPPAAAGAKPAAPPPVARPGGELRLAERLPLEQARLVLCFSTPLGYVSPQRHALLLGHCLFGAPGNPASRLFRRVREERGLAYSVSATLVRGRGLCLVEAGLAAARIGEAEEVIRAELAELAAGRFGEAELAGARRRLLDRLRAEADDAAGLITQAFADGVFGLAETREQSLAGVEAAGAPDVARALASLRPVAAYHLLPEAAHA